MTFTHFAFIAAWGFVILFFGQILLSGILYAAAGGLLGGLFILSGLLAAQYLIMRYLL